MGEQHLGSPLDGFLAEDGRLTEVCKTRIMPSFIALPIRPGLLYDNRQSAHPAQVWGWGEAAL